MSEDDDNDVCRCGHRRGEHGPDEPFDMACGVEECDCESFELKTYELYDGPPEPDIRF